MGLFRAKTQMVEREKALPGRGETVPVPDGFAGNDVGTQYRSLIAWRTDAQRRAAENSRDMLHKVLSDAGLGDITTEIVEAAPFYYAEQYHQQYLAANPNGYCGLGDTGLSCPVGIASAE